MVIAEQPSSSIFEPHPRWEQLCHILGDSMNVLRAWMQPYGAESPKATILHASTLSISSLWKARDTSQ
eukprot:8046883-Pyramimonas_sp.AAC.1